MAKTMMEAKFSAKSQQTSWRTPPRKTLTKKTLKVPKTSAAQPTKICVPYERLVVVHCQSLGRRQAYPTKPTREVQQRRWHRSCERIRV